MDKINYIMNLNSFCDTEISNTIRHSMSNSFKSA